MLEARLLMTMVSSASRRGQDAELRQYLGNVSEAMQNLMMGHASKRTILKHDLSRRVTLDTSSAMTAHSRTIYISEGVSYFSFFAERLVRKPQKRNETSKVQRAQSQIQLGKAAPTTCLSSGCQGTLGVRAAGA